MKIQLFFSILSLFFMVNIVKGESHSSSDDLHELFATFDRIFKEVTAANQLTENQQQELGSIETASNLIKEAQVCAWSLYWAPKWLIIPYEDENFFKDAIFGKLSQDDKKTILMWKADKVRAWHAILDAEGVLDTFLKLSYFQKRFSEHPNRVEMATMKLIANDFLRKFAGINTRYQITFEALDALYDQLIQSIQEGASISEVFVIEKSLSEEASLTEKENG